METVAAGREVVGVALVVTSGAAGSNASPLTLMAGWLIMSQTALKFWP